MVVVEPPISEGPRLVGDRDFGWRPWARQGLRMTDPPGGFTLGLCAVCKHRRVTGNRRGSLFHLCVLSKDDPRFPRYPPLPVLECTGFERADPDPWAAYTEEPDHE